MPCLLAIDKLTKPTDVLYCDFYSAALEDTEVKDCCGAKVLTEAYVNVPMDEGPNPTEYELIKREQQIRQEALQRLPQLDPERCMRPPGTHSF